MVEIQEAWHWLIVLHHGSHYDFHVFANYVIYNMSHKFIQPSKAVLRVIAILRRDPSVGY